MRHLDTGKTVIDVTVRRAAIDPASQRTQLIDVVMASHPGARVKSFADGVASFLDGAKLIVARYGDSAPPPPDAPLDPSGQQIQLFDAPG